MSMFCYQCQEAAKGEGCTIKGVCGKQESTSDIQDLLIYLVKGISLLEEKAHQAGDYHEENLSFVMDSLFMSITNANFDNQRIESSITTALKIRDELKKKYVANIEYDALTWSPENTQEYYTKAKEIGVLSQENEDVRSLRELAIYGIKGIAAYAHHAYALGYKSENIFKFMAEGMASTAKDLEVDEMIAIVMKTGEIAVETMALLDKANTEKFGNPELTKVNIGVRNRPGILISGHDFRDLEDLLGQTKDSGVDVYSHCEMLPANYYPHFKKYENFVGNYGNAWWQQDKEFEQFNGPIVMTTNCITPVKDSYKDRIYTSGVVGYEKVKHLKKDNGKIDYSEVIAQAKKCSSPTEIEKGEILGGFGHHQVLALADKVVGAIKEGKIKKFVVMAGCDGRQKGRNYFTEMAEQLPKDSVILTAGCAKFRYNKLDLGDIDGIPRVLDAGQCNDSYSLAVIALKLKEVLGLADINDLPIFYNIAWYEQKAVTVLLALLHLGVKGIRLGPTLPAFLSPNVAKILIDKFDINPISTVEDDLKFING